MMVRTVNTTKYLTPLREGGSLPAVIEADDGQLYVMKFAGSGHGTKALIAELLGGMIGQALGLAVPDIVFVELDPKLGPSEADWEIRGLLQASAGLNIGLRYLPGAFEYNSLLKPPPDPALASSIVWFDAFVTNVDRTPRNANILLWQGRLWLIDHGSCLYFHHSWKDYLQRSQSPFPHIKDHTLLRFASQLDAADANAHRLLSTGALESIVQLIPEVWLKSEPLFSNADEHREAYATFLRQRLQASNLFVEEAQRARAELL